MLNLFGSISSVSYQFLVLESPFIQVIFMKKHAKNLLFEGLCYNLKGLELFSETNFESSWILGVENLIEFFFVLPFWFGFLSHPLSWIKRFWRNYPDKIFSFQNWDVQKEHWKALRIIYNNLLCLGWNMNW